MLKKKTIWKIHSILGLLTGIPLLLIAFSGSVLVFKDEINSILKPDIVQTVPAQSGRKSLDALVHNVESGFPEYEVAGWAIYPEPDRTDFVYVIEHGDHEWKHVHIDPYRGTLLGTPAKAGSSLMGWMLELHYTLLAGHWGMAICGFIAVLLCALGVTGFLIHRKFWKNLFTLNWKTSWRALAGNLHKRLGVISSPVFVILGITGGYWNLSHVIEELDHLEEGEPVMEKRFYGEAISFAEMAREAREQIPGYQINYIDFPRADGGPVTFYGDFEGDNSFRSPYHSTVSFNGRTGELVNTWRVDEASLWMQTYDAFTPLHFGTFGGLLTRIIWCVLGAVPGFLALSGTFIWWRRVPGRASKKWRSQLYSKWGLTPGEEMP